LFCFPGTPIENDPRANFPNKFKIGMLEAPAKDPVWFCYGCLCMPCAQYQLRTMSLGADWPKGYQCCQGYFDCCCFKKCMSMGRGENEGVDRDCPELCLCVEVFLCPSCAVSATRFYVLDKYNIVPDPMDNKIIHFNNCLQCLSCIISIAALFIDGLDEAADIIQYIANLVFHITSGCMTAQVHYELFVGGPPGSGVAAGAPIQDEMGR